MNVAIAAPRKLDWGILLPVMGLLALGLVMVYSSSAVLGADRYHSQFFFVKRQLKHRLRNPRMAVTPTWMSLPQLCDVRLCRLTTTPYNT